MDPQVPTQPQNIPLNYVPQLNQRQVPVRLSSVNFEFAGNRANMDSLLSQNMYVKEPPGQPPRRN